MDAFIKAVGAGAKRARALTRDEARAAMARIAGGLAEPVQVGAFLLALRMKGETPDELAGFADALEAHLPRTLAEAAPDGTLEVDAHGDGHHGAVSLLPAAACAAAALGVPVCLAVELGSRWAHHGLDASLGEVGLGGALSLERAARDLGRAGVAAWDLPACPPLAHLVGLRALLGVRTAAHTAAKLVSATGGARRLLGVFHAPYLEPTAAALGLRGARGFVVQALGGLPEARGGKIVRLAYADQARATALDLRAFTTDGPSAIDVNAPQLAAAANRAALDGEAARALHAAATAALLVHAATGGDPITAARDAYAALTSGRARQIAAKLV